MEWCGGGGGGGGGSWKGFHCMDIKNINNNSNINSAFSPAFLGTLMQKGVTAHPHKNNNNKVTTRNTHTNILSLDDNVQERGITGYSVYGLNTYFTPHTYSNGRFYNELSQQFIHFPHLLQFYFSVLGLSVFTTSILPAEKKTCVEIHIFIYTHTSVLIRSWQRSDENSSQFWFPC